MKVLVVEDEELLRKSIQDFLQHEGYIHEAAASFSCAHEKIELYNYDIVLLDLGLPDGDGVNLIEVIKTRSENTGVIIISARNAIDDRVKGLEKGADDYLTKPFHLSELNARLKSLFRRLNFKGNSTYTFNELTINPDDMKACVNNKDLSLTKKEFDLLVYFLANKNRVITKITLGEHLWGDYIDTVDSLDFIYTHIKNLRKKLVNAGSVDYIKNVYGVGYKFNDE
ncbi:MAG: response regulator transcription factor [Flavobacteriales bacterium]|nr:response regulator transcription factor [Flavobacteriales bacterium]